MKEDICMDYYDVRKPLYPETDASGVGLRVALLKMRDNLSCRYDEVLKQYNVLLLSARIYQVLRYPA